jgi:hypothetical protein
MLNHSRPGTIFIIFLIPFFVNLVAAAMSLVKEVSLRPKHYRVLLIGLSFFIFFLGVFQIATGYYFAFDEGEVAAHIAVALAYVALMVLTISGMKIASRRNRIVGVFGLVIPVLIAIISPEILFAGLIITFGLQNNNSTFQGRISPGLSYRVAIDQPLFGNSDYYRYTLFRNPHRLPLLRKQISGGPIDGCKVPSLKVSFNSGTRSGFLHIDCQQTSDRLLTGQISLDQSPGVLPVTVR